MTTKSLLIDINDRFVDHGWDTPKVQPFNWQHYEACIDRLVEKVRGSNTITRIVVTTTGVVDLSTSGILSGADFHKAGGLALDALIENDHITANIIPVGKHIDYFFLMDEDGNPLKREDCPEHLVAITDES